MKKISFILISILLLIMSFGIISCGGNYVEINSIEDLYSMDSRKSYKLMTDIDLKNSDWVGLAVKNFDGNGHTISNVIVNDIAFFKDAKSIKNLTLSNIYLTTKDSETASILLYAKDDYTIENVTIKNSNLKVVSTFTGNLLNGLEVSALVTMYTRYNGEIRNCKIENTTLDITSKNADLIYVGGVCGYGDPVVSISNTVCDGLTIKLKKDSGSAIIGGLSNGISGDGANCVNSSVKNSKIQVEGTYYGGVVAGGLCGSIGDGYNDIAMTGCASINNEINVSHKYNYCVSGLVAVNSGADVLDCLVEGNVLSGERLEKDDEYLPKIASVIASNNGNVKRIISRRNDVVGTENSSSSCPSMVGGFVANNSGSISYCALLESTVSGYGVEKFCSGTQGVHLCYSDKDVNKEGVSKLEEINWSTLYEDLNLSSNYWSLNSIVGIKHIGE